MRFGKTTFIIALILGLTALAGGVFFENIRQAVRESEPPSAGLISKKKGRSQSLAVGLPRPKGTASVDDDPAMGKIDAPVTVIEFSDYECPFCKRFYNETLPRIKEKYINTGKVKFVYRDFPLAFHDPVATNEAVAANCAREQGGDSKYFDYHNEIFNRTKSNGKGFGQEGFGRIASDIGLDLERFDSCINDKTVENEVKKDINDGMDAGASGTPTFVIGRTAVNGEVAGELVFGAQPFAVFQAIIDPLL